MHLYFKLVNVKKSIATLGECMRKNCTCPCAFREYQISWPLNCGTCWWFTLNVGNAVNKKKKVLMIANLVLLNPGFAQCLFSKFSFLCLLQHTGVLLASNACVSRFILLLKCLFLTETIACSFLLGREVMVLFENMEKTNTWDNFLKQN